MGTLADQLAGKAAGDLIKAADWNALITAVEGIQTSVATLSASVDSRLAAVDGRLTALENRATAAESALATLTTTVNDLRQHFRRVTLRTTSATYAVGEEAVIVAQVTDVGGAALDLTNPANRPWVDFVTVWGQLRPAAGSAGQSSEGGRALAVQVNAQGEARAVLRASTAEGVSTEAEGAMKALLASNTSGGRSVARILLDNDSPLNGEVSQAFGMVTAQYDASPAMRDYLDGRYVKNPSVAASRFGATQHGTWRDHRVTVLALARADSNPLTPDASLGSCSLQVTFRDWVGPWIVGHYFGDVVNVAKGYKDNIANRIDHDYAATVDRVKKAVDGLVQDKGIIGKQKVLAAIRDAVGQITVTDPPPFLAQLTSAVRDAAVLQQSMEYTQYTAIGLDKPAAAFEVLTDANVRADTQAAAAKTELTNLVQAQIGQVQETVQNQVRQSQQTFQSELLKEDGPIKTVQKNLADISGKVNGFQVALNKKADLTALIPR